MEQRATVNNENYRNAQLTIHAYYKRTFSPYLNLKTGLIGTGMNFDLTQVRWRPESELQDTVLSGNNKQEGFLSNSWMPPTTLQPYFQFSYRPAFRWIFNFGAHSMYANFGGQQFVLEPRAAIQYSLSDRTRLSLSYGMHSRVPPMGSYFVRNGQNFPNYSLDLIRSNHYIFAVNQQLSSSMTLHVEAYHQQLWQVPVGLRSGFVYWSLNDIQGFANEAMASLGKGQNTGVDVVLEKNFSRGTFFLLSASVFSSTFTVPEDNRRFSTQYDSRYTFTFTGGKTWQLNKSTWLESGFRLLFNGGNPITPLASGFEILDGEDPVLDKTNPFSRRVKPYIRPDLRVALRRNTAKVSYWVGLDIQNVINRRNEDALDYEFDVMLGRWGSRLQGPLTPLITFEMHF